MPADISVENSELIGLWLQLLATGAYLTYFARCVVFFKKDWRRRSSFWLPIVCFLMFLSTITDQVLALVRAYQAFGVRGGLKPDPTAFYAHPATKLSVSKNSFNVVLTFLSDIVIVYRTFVIWNFRVLVIVLPVTFVMVNLALGVLTLVALAQAGTGDNQIFALVSVRFKYYLILTFCLNVLCAGLICFKIWRINTRVVHVLPSTTRRVLEVIIQSAGIYCVHLLILIITNAAGTNMFFVFLDPLPPMAATIFSMMIVRAREDDASSSSHVTSATRSNFSNGSRLWPNRQPRAHAPVSIGVEIDLERVINTDRGSVRHAESVCDEAIGCLDKATGTSARSSTKAEVV